MQYRKALQIPVSALVAMRDDFISQVLAWCLAEPASSRHTSFGKHA